MPALPKPPGTTRRRNRPPVPGRILHAAPDPKPTRAPRLPADLRDWAAPTRAWWRDVWASPMAAEFLASDRHGLLALAVLVDDFWTTTEPRTRAALAAEIRLQSQRYGLSPIDRRRLAWAVERGDAADQRRRQRNRPTPTPGPDPRDALT